MLGIGGQWNGSRSIRQALRHAYEEVGVSGVPMFGIGEQVLTGLQDRGTLEAVIDEELAKSRGRGSA